MAQIEADTNKMRECGNDIMQLAIEIGDQFNNLFNRIQNMPVKTGEWTGVAASTFVSSVLAEKAQYMQLKDELYNYGKYLVEGANDLESEIRSL